MFPLDVVIMMGQHCGCRSLVLQHQANSMNLFIIKWIYSGARINRNAFFDWSLVSPDFWCNVRAINEDEGTQSLWLPLIIGSQRSRNGGCYQMWSHVEIGVDALPCICIASVISSILWSMQYADKHDMKKTMLSEIGSMHQTSDHFVNVAHSAHACLGFSNPMGKLNMKLNVNALVDPLFRLQKLK